MSEYAYLFQAKGIQRFILEGGKLKGMVGASEIVASLCRSDGGDLLEKVLDASEFPEKRRFSRRAGGAFMLHYDDAQEKAFERFRALWRLTVSLSAPGLEFTESCGGGEDFLAARADVRNQSSVVRENALASLAPLAGPLVKRARRTGLAAAPAPSYLVKDDEDLDSVTLCKRRMEDLLSQKLIKGGVASRFEPDEPPPGGAWLWPRNMDENDDHSVGETRFPFVNGKRWVGVIHADISGLGQIWRNFEAGLKSEAAEAAETCLNLSRAIEGAIAAAAKAAVKTCLVPEALRLGGVMPARPIVLGGDDLTMIVRGDLALDFAKAFLEQLEEEKIDGLRRKLTACAGVAFLKASQPFTMASELAEELCSYAKNAVKKGLGANEIVPSAIAFHRVTSSLIGDYETIVEETRIAKGYRLTRGPYLVGAEPKEGLARLSDLEALKTWIGDARVSVGPLRSLESLMFTDPPAARKGYARWLKNMERKEGVDVSEFKKRLGDLVAGELEEDLPCGGMATPLFDALDWRELA